MGKANKGFETTWILSKDRNYLVSEKAKTHKPHYLIISEALEIYRRQKINVLGGQNAGDNKKR